MNFSLLKELEDYRRRVRTFVDAHVVPLEIRPEVFDEHENMGVGYLRPLQEKAKDAGLWSPQMPKEPGGQGLPMVGLAACQVEMYRSVLGSVVFNCCSPDDGNMTLLNKAATEAQKDKWLQPIIDGRVRSAFAMTEPAPGSGSDPGGMMRTKATPKGDKWIIEGHKWFITGAGVAEHFIVVARTSDDSRKGLTAFLFHRDQPGREIVRRIAVMGPEEHGGHCELTFQSLEVPDENRHMEIGDGLKVTQVRLGFARLTQ